MLSGKTVESRTRLGSPELEESVSRSQTIDRGNEPLPRSGTSKGRVALPEDAKNTEEGMRCLPLPPAPQVMNGLSEEIVTHSRQPDASTV
jgi:hypothetical protein